MNPDQHTPRTSLNYFVLLFVLTIPFWALGFLPGQLFPKSMPIALPLSALAALNPMIAALILTWREGRWGGVKDLFRRAFDARRIKPWVWYLPIVLIMPLVMLIEYGLTLLFGPHIDNPYVPLGSAAPLFVGFFLGAIGEELGWTGYAINPLQDRYGALGGSLIVGGVWAAWHIIGFYQVHPDFGWIVWQCMVTVLLRVIIVWLCNNTGRSVLPAILFHSMINESNFMYPNYGSHYDPMVAAIILAVMAVAVVVVWGPKTLARPLTRYLSADGALDR